MPADAATPEIILDLSRLLSRVRYDAPTGVDRVEMAYATHLGRMAPERLCFAAVHPSGAYGRLPRSEVEAFLDHTQQIWQGAKTRTSGTLRSKLDLINTLRRMAPRSGEAAVPEQFRPRVYLQASPHHLDRPGLVGKILIKEKAQFICLVHDLIPIEYEEYARPNGANLHRRRMDTLIRFADGVMANSEATKASL